LLFGLERSTATETIKPLDSKEQNAHSHKLFIVADNPIFDEFLKILVIPNGVHKRWLIGRPMLEI
jgi:hypothetical protein